MTDTTYASITDWSVEGRRRLVDARGDVIRLLLDGAFTELVDAGVSLGEYGFRGDDPVSEAVEWCIERFSRADLDPRSLHSGSASERLFTEGAFWLSQRVGAAAYRGIRARQVGAAGAMDRVTDTAAPTPSDAVIENLSATSQRARIVTGVRALRDATCASLVAWWLEGATSLREAIFEREADAIEWEDAAKAEDRSPKQRSFHIADALFRYVALFFGLVRRDGGGDESHRACVLTWFTRCDDAPPYERVRADVLAAFDGRPSREVTTLRHAGLTTLVRRCVDVAAQHANDPDEAVCWLARRSLRPSLLHRFKIDAPPLSSALAALKGAAR